MWKGASICLVQGWELLSVPFLCLLFSWWISPKKPQEIIHDRIQTALVWKLEYRYWMSLLTKGFLLRCTRNQLCSPHRFVKQSWLRCPPYRSVPYRKISQASLLLQQMKQDRNEKQSVDTKAGKPNTLQRPDTTLKVTKEQLLAKANNMYSRFKIRLKWLLKKSNRPFNTDDYSAFFSWIVVGNVFLFFVATTTFFSLVIFTANTVFAQEFVARKFGEIITKNSNITVTFESAIVPGWSDGKISFRKCFVSRRPKRSRNSPRDPKKRSTKRVYLLMTTWMKAKKTFLKTMETTLSLISQ